MKKTSLFNRLSFLRENYSLAEISREADIPYSTLYRYANQKGSLPSKYESDLYKTYQHGAYGVLKERGFSSKLASKYSQYTPERLHMFVGDEQELINRYTLFNVQKKYPGRTLTLNEAMNSPFWSNYRNSIEQAVRNRQKMIEDYQPGETLPESYV